MIARRTPNRNRRGAAMVEAAIVLPVLMTVMLGLIIGAMGIFKYQQVALLAREGARYASVRGYASTSDPNHTHPPAATPQTVYDQAIVPMATGLILSDLNSSVTWTDPSKAPVYLANANTNTWRRNAVTVQVSYTWRPVAIFPTLTMSSTSVMPITY
jgi:Flp pilus assembly protein TadG